MVVHTHHSHKDSADHPRMAEPIPFVIVEGFLGGAGAALWGDFERFLNMGSKNVRRTIFASVGPVSSLHDRACELFYTLMGGVVDYGEDHSKHHSHSRYGRMNSEGLYPLWSRLHPLHFLGHSMGGPTITKLHSLLKQGHFGSGGHPDMILSINTVSSPFRGTQLVYMLGERADAAPAVRSLSIGSILAKCVHLITFFAPLSPRALDFHAEARSLSFRETTFLSFIKQLWKSDWAEGRDATPFDVTFEAADERECNLDGQVNANTFYRSHVARLDSSFHLKYILSAPLYITSRLMESFDYSILRPMPSFLECSDLYPHTIFHYGRGDVEKNQTYKNSIGEEYRANDGVVPLFSQWHPLECRCRHQEDAMEDLDISLNPGIWHVYQINGANHLSLLPFWMGDLRQKRFWESMGEWLRGVDEKTQVKRLVNS